MMPCSAGSYARASDSVTRRDHVDPQHLHGRERQRQAEHDRDEDDEGLRAVGRQQEDDRLAQVVVDAPALADRAADRGEVVVGEHDLGGFLRRLGALDAHRDADVGARQRGRVVDAVAGHRHDLAVGLQRAHDADLVLGARAGVDVDVAHDLLQLVLAQRLQLGPGEHARVVAADEAHLAADRQRRAGVVAVIIFTRMPAAWQSAMASMASGRGGSRMPQTPRNSRSGEVVELDLVGARRRTGLRAAASTRRPSPPGRRSTASQRTRSSGSAAGGAALRRASAPAAGPARP